MALYAFDGTGNEDKEGEGHDSNVLQFFRGYLDPLKNDDSKKKRGSLYLKGIGTRSRSIVFRSLAEAFGFGGHARIDDALDRLEGNIAGGDSVIDVVGFSRGAALAMSFANTILKHMPGREINFVGVWDIVAEFGLPGEHLNAGHDMRFASNIKNCYHGMAMDERRAVFQLTRLTGSGQNEDGRLTETWFRGVHSDVGGGNDNPTLNYIALNWMYENAKRHNLPIDENAVAANLARRKDPMKISHKPEVGPFRHFRTDDILHASVSFDPLQSDSANRLNNPSIVLARMGDDGAISRGAAAGAVNV